MFRDPAALRIIQSVAAVTRERARVYPKRKAKSRRHWLRMDKKFLKSFGMKETPAMFMLADMGMGESLVVHPALMPKLRALTHAK
jgi:hypothetical protein